MVLQFAAEVLSAPEGDRKKLVGKMIERCIRMGARLAVEFGMPAPLFVEIAKGRIVHEGGQEAQTALADAFGEDVMSALSNAEEGVVAFQAQVAEIFTTGSEPPKA